MLCIAPQIIEMAIKLATDHLSQPLELTNYATFPYNIVENENEAHFVLECSLYNFIEDKFSLLLENVVL